MEQLRRRNTDLNACLADMDERIMTDGRLKIFAIGFVTKTGTYIYLQRAIACNVRQNMKRFDFKGVVEIDEEGREVGHRYPVYIHAILYYKSQTFFYES